MSIQLGMALEDLLSAMKSNISHSRIFSLFRFRHILLDFSSSAILQTYKKHLTEAIPWLANELITKEKSLKVCFGKIAVGIAKLLGILRSISPRIGDMLLVSYMW